MFRSSRHSVDQRRRHGSAHYGRTHRAGPRPEQTAGAYPIGNHRSHDEPASLNPLRLLVVTVIVTFCAGLLTTVSNADAQTGKQLPILQVDPLWPQLPETWILGASAGIATDNFDNVWIIHL